MLLTKSELRVMEVLWQRGGCPIRKIHNALPEQDRLAYAVFRMSLIVIMSTAGWVASQP
jgi:predicted transcriptional regulator